MTGEKPRDAWSPAVYERFRAERSRPFFDLLALVEPRPGMRAVDLGCGTGELTRELHRRLSAKETLGLDGSAEMLGKSAAFAGDGLSFQQGSIEGFAPETPLDLVFSNAALHWVDDHPALLARLRGFLRGGGQLAVQVPAMHEQTAHVAADDVAREEPFRTALGGYLRTSPVLAPEAYAALLHSLGAVDQHVRLQVYGHVLPSRDDVVEWVRGTLLTDYERRLPAGLYARYLARYREVLAARLEDAHPFFFPYRRILFWASF